MMTLMMIVALEVADGRVVAAINNVCRVSGQTSGFPLIRSNMGEPGVWGCFRSFAFHSHFLPRSTNLVKYGGTWCVGVFPIFCFSLSLSTAFHSFGQIWGNMVCGVVSDLLLFTLTFYHAPLIRSNMGEHGVWGCFGSFAFHSHFLLRSTNLVKYGGTWCVGGVFRIFCFSLSLYTTFR